MSMNRNEERSLTGAAPVRVNSRHDHEPLSDLAEYIYMPRPHLRARPNGHSESCGPGPGLYAGARRNSESNSDRAPAVFAPQHRCTIRKELTEGGQKSLHISQSALRDNYI